MKYLLTIIKILVIIIGVLAIGGMAVILLDSKLKGKVIPHGDIVGFWALIRADFFFFLAYIILRRTLKKN